ncbi:hypothetical protein CTI12_AA540650 [Artemisia annua]|uniref:Uncharacterized protein n=1 Tax=Artemisia annua TaxID=35608 RepID=A0A2U1L2A9_ARTAN|nr:hypothetical protein CTI12_AA540650 [Artemisia annua]
MSGIGKPLIMDKMTRDRCINKRGKSSYARVLVEVSADFDLPKFVEIEYPAKNLNVGKVKCLEVGYQWKPPQCTFCCVFGHSHEECIVRPKCAAEIEAIEAFEASKIAERLQWLRRNKKSLLLSHVFGPSNGASSSRKNSYAVPSKVGSKKVFKAPSKPVRIDKMKNVLSNNSNDMEVTNSYGILEDVEDDWDVENDMYLDEKLAVDEFLKVKEYPLSDGTGQFMKVQYEPGEMEMHEETHVSKQKLNRVCSKVFGNWNWLSNTACCEDYTRIIIGWDPNSVDVMILDQSDLVVHCFVESINSDES